MMTELIDHQSGWRRRVQVRPHPRATRLTLRADPVRRRITCTVPERTSPRLVERFLADHRGWIERQMRAFPTPQAISCGSSLPFRGETLQLSIGPHEGRRVERLGTMLSLPAGPVQPRDRLRGWLMEQARHYYSQQARHLAARLSLPPPPISVRDPRSRWGSCSARGHLSLSWRLILAPDMVSGYVVAHEVAHLRHRNHGPAFWALTRDLWPQMDAAERWLKQNGACLHAILATDAGPSGADPQAT